MKKVDYLIIQSTESGEGIPVTKEDIIDLHTTDKKLGGYGFNRPGIDYLIQPDGSMKTLVSEDNPTTVDLWGISEGKKGVLGICKHIAYVGGRTEKEVKPKDSRTTAQIKSLEAIVKFYVLKFPKIQVLGLDEAPAMKGKENPAFSVSIWLEEIGVPEINIFKKIKKE
ncbi:N-acetylmuramoyl-L-alanine amidase [Aquimarina algiphila]|uniref:N-acetylmuramoyl-L-alanine amidase n=1 Tax=Aquimarina algiphila TaxID=2047982 RepID=A0A554VJ66_9FLAO|nr:N-acetylmuramoyl-L-alanine amidase [Aquimarina algiphila]TSE07914.1 N-acetylmuramoyl-L-alanine amidase [Aquimarina algiphila]